MKYRLGQTRLGSMQRFPRSLAEFKGILLGGEYGKGAEKRERKGGVEMEGKGKEWKGKGGKEIVVGSKNPQKRLCKNTALFALLLAVV